MQNPHDLVRTGREGNQKRELFVSDLPDDESTATPSTLQSAAPTERPASTETATPHRRHRKTPKTPKTPTPSHQLELLPLEDARQLPSSKRKSSAPGWHGLG